MPPLLLAAILYLGSGVGLLAWLAVRRAFGGAAQSASLAGTDHLWLAAAIAAGGVIAPVLLVFGLVRTDGATASLLLNLDVMAIVAGGLLLAWHYPDLHHRHDH